MTRLILALSLALVPVTASAAPAAGAQKAANTVQPKAQESVRIYEFPDDDVPGEVLLSEGINIPTRTTGQRESLIKVRTHFIPQMLKMAIDV